MEEKAYIKSIFTFIQQRYIFTGIGIILAILAIITPYNNLVESEQYVGWLLVWAAILEILHGFKRSVNYTRYSAWVSGGISLLIGILLLNAQLFQKSPLLNLIAILLAADALRYFIFYFRHPRN